MAKEQNNSIWLNEFDHAGYDTSGSFKDIDVYNVGFLSSRVNVIKLTHGNRKNLLIVRGFYEQY